MIDLQRLRVLNSPTVAENTCIFHMTNFEKDVEHFSIEYRTTSIVTSYIEKRNAVERDVDGDSVELSFSISIDKVRLNTFICP